VVEQVNREALLLAITNLERNVRVSRSDLTIDDDELAGLLGKALAKNTSHKYFLKLTPGARLSAQGAQSILDGKSPVSSFTSAATTGGLTLLDLLAFITL
jgi:hypothetical protein